MWLGGGPEIVCVCVRISYKMIICSKSFRLKARLLNALEIESLDSSVSITLRLRALNGLKLCQETECDGVVVRPSEEMVWLTFFIVKRLR